MVERAGEGLLDLGADRGVGVVGQAVVLTLTALEGELGLQEQVVPGFTGVLPEVRPTTPVTPCPAS